MARACTSDIRSAACVAVLLLAGCAAPIQPPIGEVAVTSTFPLVTQGTDDASAPILWQFADKVWRNDSATLNSNSPELTLRLISSGDDIIVHATSFDGCFLQFSDEPKGPNTTFVQRRVSLGRAADIDLRAPCNGSVSVVTTKS